MKNAYIIHHLGLGDHIVCNGLVRELVKKYDLIYFPVKRHNLETIKYMFKDIAYAIKYIPVNTDREMIYLWHCNRQDLSDCIRLGNFYESNFVSKHDNFCRGFYENANIDYDKRWESFYVEYTNPKISTDKTDYNFIHEDKTRGYEISHQYKNGSYFQPNHALGQDSQSTIFDYYNVIKNSKEIHCMDSSFSAWIDHIQELKDKPKYVHRYVKKYKEPDGMWQLYRNNWQILENPESI